MKLLGAENPTCVSFSFESSLLLNHRYLKCHPDNFANSNNCVKLESQTMQPHMLGASFCAKLLWLQSGAFLFLQSCCGLSLAQSYLCEVTVASCVHFWLCNVAVV